VGRYSYSLPARKKKIDLVEERTVAILEAMTDEVKEIASYDSDVLRDIFTYAGIKTKLSRYSIDSDYEVRLSVLNYIGIICRTHKDTRLKRTWDKSISGIDTFIYLAE